MVASYALIEELKCLEHDAEFIAARAAIKPGFVPRQPGHPTYIAYRNYNRALEVFAECEDAVRIVAADPLLRIAFFRTFGYRGEVNFTMMPQVWLRELPLLVIGRGAHLGRGAVLGTGQITPDGSGVSLLPIAIGERTVLGDFAIVEGGAILGSDVTLGTRSLVGGACHISDGAILGDGVRVGPEVVLGAGAVVGSGASIGAGAVIDPGVVVGEGVRIPARHRLTDAGLFPLLQARIAA